MLIKNLGQEKGFWLQVNLETSPPILIVSDPKTQKQEYIFGKLDVFQYFCFNLKKFIANARIEIRKDKAVCWRKNELAHREDGPAIVYSDGSESWHKDGKRHREDGPAFIRKDGHKEWWKNGLCHREDGPAIIQIDGSKEWWKNGLCHREDGPAIVKADGTKQWYLWNRGYPEQKWRYLVKAKQNAD